MKYAYDLELKVTESIESIWNEADTLRDSHVSILPRISTESLHYASHCNR